MTRDPPAQGARCPPLFDAQIQAGALSAADCEDLAFFGVEGAVLVAGDDLPTQGAQEVLAFFDRLGREAAPRLKRAGIAPFVALGVHPARLPERGLAEVLAKLPSLFNGARVVAIGTIGLEDGGAVEEQAFLRQLEVAQEVGRPVLVHTPEREKLKLTRRILALLKESGVPATRVMVGQVNAATLRLVRECGHTACLSVHPARLSPEEAVVLVRKHGSTDLVLASNAGSGAGDLLALPRTAMLLQKGRLGEEIVGRVCRENALAFFGIDPETLGARAAAGRLA